MAIFLNVLLLKNMNSVWSFRYTNPFPPPPPWETGWVDVVLYIGDKYGRIQGRRYWGCAPLPEVLVFT